MSRSHIICLAKRLAQLCLLFIGCVAWGGKPQLSSEERAWVLATKSVTIALDSENPPMNFVDGDGTCRGLSVDYMRLIGEKLGLGIQYYPTTWREGLKLALDHRVDGIMTASIKEDRKQFLNFSKAYCTTPQAMIAKDDGRVYHTLRDFNGMRIGVVAGSVRIALLDEICPDSVLVETSSSLVAAKLLTEGQIDVFFDDLPVVQNIIDSQMMYNLRVALLYLHSDLGEAHVGLRNDDPLLTAVFDKAIDSISTQEHAAIRKRWLHIAEGVQAQQHLPLTVEERTWLRDHPLIRVAVDPHLAPVEWMDKNGQPKGIAIDYLKHLESSLDVTIQLIPADSAMHARDLGVMQQVDLLCTLPENDSMSEHFLFTKSYLTLDIAIFGTADAGYIQALNQLAGKTIVVCKNRAAENYFRQMHPELHLLTVPTVSEGILALRRGEAYCMVESVLPMTHALMEKGDASLRIIGDVPFVCEQRLAIRKDWPVLLGILDEALDQVSLEEQQAFKRKWMSIQVQQPPDYSLVYKIGIPIVAFLLLSLYWNRKLSTHAKRRRLAEEKSRIYQDRLEALIQDRTSQLKNASSQLIKLGTAIEQTAEGVIITDVEGEITYVNHAVSRISGFSEARLLGRPLEDIYGRNYDLGAASNSDPGERNQRLKLPCKDGHSVMVEVSVTAVRDENGEVSCFISILRDISKVRQLELRLSQALDLTSASVLEYDVETRMIHFGERAQSTFGVPSLLSLPDWESNFVLQEDQYATSRGLMSLLNGMKGKGEIRLRIRHPENGEVFTILARGGVADRDKEGKALRVTGTVIDITRQEQMEKRLNQSAKLEAIGTLAGGVAHDFNNILAAIVGTAELVKLTQQEDAISTRMNQILECSQRGKELVNQILTFARSHSAERLPVHIADALRSTVKMLKHTLPSSIEIVMNIKTDAYILGDRTKLNQIMLNLGTNAGLAMKNGGLLTIDLVEVKVVSSDERSLPPGDYVKLIVSDTGVGIPTDLQPRIFEPFFSTRDPGEGTGMGLAVVHGIVHDWGGSISVTSIPDIGSTFTVLFPRTESPPDETSVEEDTLSRGKERILFVDDEITLTKLATDVLPELGFTITTYNSSPQALEAFEENPQAYDLVITDMTMPVMCGDELAKAIHDLRPDLPIILCTGNSVDLEPGSLEGMGVTRILQKPIILRDLTKVIREVLPRTVSP